MSPSPRSVAAALVAATALIAPAAASASVHSDNGFYGMGYAADSALALLTGADHSAGQGRNLSHDGDQGIDSAVRDYTTSQTHVMNSSYLGNAETEYVDPGDYSKGIYQEYAVGDLTLRRTGKVEGTTEADSLATVTLSVSNTGSQPHLIGAQTVVRNYVYEDSNPLFTPWQGTTTAKTAHVVAPTFKQFDLVDDDIDDNRCRGARFVCGNPYVRSTWSIDRPDLGATTPDVFDLGHSPDDPYNDFAVANADGDDIGDNDETFSTWIWGQDSAHARTVAPGQTVNFTIATVADPPDTVPVNSVAPSIGGPQVVGRPLSSTDGTWAPVTRFTQYPRQWLRCDADGANCVPIPGATDATYTPTADDVGRVLVVEVTADRAEAVRSAVSQPVAPAPAAAAAAAQAAPAGPATAPAAAAPKRVVAKATVLFASSRAGLGSAARARLRKLAARNRQVTRITCTGYTASANGRSSYRTALGRRRAKAVCDFLAARLEAGSVVTRTKAGADPVASNATRAGRARNRRVVVEVVSAG